MEIVVAEVVADLHQEVDAEFEFFDVGGRGDEFVLGCVLFLEMHQSAPEGVVVEVVHHALVVADLSLLEARLQDVD